MSAKYYWSWPKYWIGALGWVCSVCIMINGPMQIVKELTMADPSPASTPLVPTWGLLSYIWTVSQVFCCLLMTPVLVQWCGGFFWMGGIKSTTEGMARGSTAVPSGEDLDSPLLRVAGGSVLFCFRVVTRGDNPVLVRDACRQNAALLSELGVASVIEVVTDNGVGLDNVTGGARPNPETLGGCASVHQLVVPPSYQTTKGTLYKARALNYALEPGVSYMEDDDIIVHLDEETLLHETSVRGILHFASAAPAGRGQDRRIGQGMIVYGRGDILQLVLTCADSLRVADDYCRFRMFLSSGSGLIGIHGSFVVCRAAVERDVTFDFGPAGSVTEDAFFAVAASERGCTFEFIDGFMEEKSPFTIMDFVKQRRRWIQGIRILARSPQFSLRRRWFLRLTSDAWFLSPCMMPNIIITALAVHYRAQLLLPKEFLTFQAIASGTSFWVYAFGACFNFAVKDSPLLYVKRVLLTLVLWPLFGMLEGICVLYTWFTPENKHSPSFHVVKKEYKELHKREQQITAKSVA